MRLILGQDLCQHPFDADLRCHRLCRAFIVAGEQHHIAPQRLQPRDCFGAVTFHGIRHGNHAQQPFFLREKQGRFPLLCQFLRRMAQRAGIDACQRHKPLVAGIDRRTVKLCLYAAAGHGGKIRHRAQRHTALLRLVDDRAGQGMLRGLLRRCRHTQQVFCRYALGTENIRYLRQSLRDRARLVQHHRLYPVHQLQALRRFDQNALFCRLTGAHHNRHRRGKAQRTGAGDHQYRNADGQAEMQRHMPRKVP